MKIRFESDDDLLLGKTFVIDDMIIVTASLLEKVSKCSWVNARISYDFSEVIDVNKTSLSKECMLCDYWYFKDVGFKFEPHVCNKCHDILI